MLTVKNMFLITASIVLVVILMKLYTSHREPFETITTMRELVNKGTVNMTFQTLNVELIDPCEIIGRIFLDYYVGTINIHLGDLELVFDKTSTKILNKGKKLHELDFGLTTKTLYNLRILLYPIENFIAIVINDRLLFSEFIDGIDKPSINVQFVVKDVANGQRTFFEAKKSEYVFLTSDVELCKLHVGNRYLDSSSGIPALVNGDNQPGSIWTIERNDKYYAIKSIKDNLYLGFKPTLYLSNNSDDGTKLIILSKGSDCIVFNKTSYVLNIEAGKMDSVFYSVLKLDKVANIEKWINYGSTFNFINSTKEYLSGNPNLKYDFKGSSGLSAVYTDIIADNQLINWTIEDLENRSTGHLVKEGNNVYFKNNGHYLQAIKGYITPSGNGMEISLGAEKNNDSKWVIKHIGNSKGLFKKDDKVYLYHPKTQTYLYSSGKGFTISGHSKYEVLGLDKRDTNSMWTIGNTIIIENLKDEETVDYYRYKKNQDYLTSKERLWKSMLDVEDKRVKEQLSRYNKLKGIEDDLERDIKKVEDSIGNLQKTKCPNKKVCQKVVYGDCIPDKTVKPYEIIYKKGNGGLVKSTKWINTSDIGRCKTLGDFNIEDSPYVKNKTYVKKTPMAKDNMSVDTISK